MGRNEISPQSMLNKIGRISEESAVLHAKATLAYADTNDHALEADPIELDGYKDIVLEIKVTTLANTTAQTLTIGVATSHHLLTGDEAVAELTADYWKTKVITLNAGVDVFYYKIHIPANEILGKYLYTKYAYGADPTGDPTIEVKLNLI